MLRHSAAITTPFPDEPRLDPVARWRKEGDALIADRERAKQELRDEEQAQVRAAAGKTTADWCQYFEARIAQETDRIVTGAGAALGQARRELREQLRAEIATLRSELIGRDQELLTLRTGPHGARGPKGNSGPQGPQGPRGDCGPPGDAPDIIVRWEMDLERYTAAPIYKDGGVGPALDLRQFFVKFLQDMRADR